MRKGSNGGFEIVQGRLTARDAEDCVDVELLEPMEEVLADEDFVRHDYDETCHFKARFAVLVRQVGGLVFSLLIKSRKRSRCREVCNNIHTREEGVAASLWIEESLRPE
jgi:hypothetical protein